MQASLGVIVCCHDHQQAYIFCPGRDGRSFPAEIRAAVYWGVDDVNGRMEHAAEILGMAGWFNREIIDCVATDARATNEPNIEPQRKVDIDGQKVAYYHANMMPPPHQPKPFPVDRKAALKAEGLLATSDEARARMAAGGPTPDHYNPMSTIGEGAIKPRSISPHTDD